jgi:Protein of unknown function (DUF3489)
MIKLTTEATGTAPPTGAEKAKPGNRARVGPKRAHVASKAVPKANASKKPPKAVKKTGVARNGSKAAKVLGLLKRPDGVTLKELMKATGWQAHSVRGFLSGTVGKKMALAVTSAKGEDGERTYSVQARVSPLPSLSRRRRSGSRRLSPSYTTHTSADQSDSASHKMAAISQQHRYIHAGAPARSSAISSKVRPSPSSTAFLPVKFCHLSAATSM